MDVTALYRDSLVWDDHCGFEFEPDAPLESQLRPWREAGVDYLSVNVYFDPRPWTRAVENIAAIRRRLPDEVPYARLVSTVAEVEADPERATEVVTTPGGHIRAVAEEEEGVAEVAAGVAEE